MSEFTVRILTVWLIVIIISKSLCWDVTVTCPLAESYIIDRAAHEPGAAAEMAASHKVEKYVDHGARYIFEPIAVETFGVFRSYPLFSFLI